MFDFLTFLGVFVIASLLIGVKKLDLKTFIQIVLFLWDISGALLPDIFNFSKKTFFNLIFVLDLLKIQLKELKELLKMLKCQIKVLKSCSKSIFR